MHVYTYALRRLTNTMTFTFWQHTPYSGPVAPVTVRTADGVALSATLLSRGHPDVLIICHGFASNQGSQGIVWLAEALLGTWDILTFDWRGYGRSGGQSSFGGDEAQDLSAMLRYARECGYRRIGVIGESMGGFITLATLGALAGSTHTEQADTPYPDRIATLAAPADLALTVWPRPQLMKHMAPYAWARPIAPLIGFRMGHLHVPSPLDVVGNIPVPLLMIHGDADRTVLVRNAYLYHEHAPGATLRIYHGIDHGVEAMRIQCRRKLVNDLHEHFRAM
jgi:pimeloyl-ACP methyl ester carboxylesterase